MAHGSPKTKGESSALKTIGPVCETKPDEAKAVVRANADGNRIDPSTSYGICYRYRSL